MENVLENVLEKGSHVDYASLRSSDLLPAFMDLLRSMGSEDHQRLLIEIGEWVLENSDKDFWNEYQNDDLSEFVNDAIDALNNYVPDGCYFGAHCGNGSDFGVWECED